MTLGRGKKRLSSSLRTVEIQRAHVMDKMGAKSPPELIRLALAADLRLIRDQPETGIAAGAC
jgi:hypothetical protein